MQCEALCRDREPPGAAAARLLLLQRPALVQLDAPALGTPYYELRFRNNYVTGIVATGRLDRFLSYGVHLERFKRDQWYAVPRKLSAEVRRLTVGLSPLHVTPAALAKSR